VTYVIAEPCIDIKDKSCVEAYAAEHDVRNEPL
jgi:hypothetical protein